MLRISRHLASSLNLHSYMMASAMHAICLESIVTYSAQAKISPQEFQSALHDIDNLRPLPPLHERLHLVSRVEVLAEIQGLLILPDEQAAEDCGIEDANLTLGEFQSLLIWNGVQWNGLLRAANKRFDQHVETARMDVGVERNRHAEETSMANGHSLQEQFDLAVTASGTAAVPLLTELVVNRFDWFPHILATTLRVEDRLHARDRAIPILLALARYRTEHERFPDSLDALTPYLLPELPVEPITQSSYRYQSDGAILLLYSISYDQVDDGGRQYKDQSDGPYDELTIADYPLQ